MGLFQSFDICASGMTAQRLRMDTIADNIANINTTRTEDGGPYTRKVVTFTEKTLGSSSFADILDKKQAYLGDGVKVSRIYEDTSTDYIMEYDPSHPDADENGYVTYPNVNIITEMTNLIDASRSYEANATAFNASKTIAMQGLNLGK